MPPFIVNVPQAPAEPILQDPPKLLARLQVMNEKLDAFKMDKIQDVTSSDAEKLCLTLLSNLQEHSPSYHKYLGHCEGRGQQYPETPKDNTVKGLVNCN
ncbi:hypothetical protein K7X08_020559 [Anisodus acutangulus]|uniref:Uncharacterized protein n=1 Tax=Anisodus acutangulus TaxID=402998 RepID=A0A9Q1RQ35_9SOLA|nr:hypothetical protein K7X08_020559 [Anisodus acutangulus]